MAISIGAAAAAVGRYVARQPFSLLRVARHAAAMRVAVPLDIFRWLVEQLPSSANAPREVVISARPPALHLGATLDVMHTTVRAQISITIRSIEVAPDRLTLTVGLSDLDLALIGDSSTPVAGLLKSGALDLSKPGNLVNMMPSRPDAIVSNTEDSIVLDLLKIPALGANPSVAKALRAVTPVATIVEICTDQDMLLVGFRVTPTGLPAALVAVRA